jgi:hypothetical protein
MKKNVPIARGTATKLDSISRQPTVNAGFVVQAHDKGFNRKGERMKARWIALTWLLIVGYCVGFWLVSIYMARAYFER